MGNPLKNFVFETEQDLKVLVTYIYGLRCCEKEIDRQIDGGREGGRGDR